MVLAVFQTQILCAFHGQVQVPHMREALRHQHAAQEAHGRARAGGPLRVRAVRRQTQGEVLLHGTHARPPRGETFQVRLHSDYEFLQLTSSLDIGLIVLTGSGI